jgi:hypothetical protein
MGEDYQEMAREPESRTFAGTQKRFMTAPCIFLAWV